MLDFSALEKALSRLKRHHRFTVDEEDSEHKFAFETAAIQSFEYTYEAALKMLKRVMENSLIAFETLDQLNFKEFIRAAAENGFIDDVNLWFSYREKRNITSHTYDEKKAEIVFAVIPSFIDEAERLLKKLKTKNVS